MELGILRNKKIHKKKCNNYITLMVIPDPTKKAKVLKIHKWLRFPIMIASVAIVLGGFYLVDYMARLEYQTVADRHTMQIDKYTIEDKDNVIESLEVTNEDHYEKLQELENLQADLEAHLEEIQAYKEELDMLVNSTEKTTSEQPAELEEVQAAAPVINLTTGEPVEAEDVSEQTVTDEVDESSEEVLKYQEFIPTYESTISYELQNFDDQYSEIMERFESTKSELEMEQTDYEVLDEELDVMIPFWESYPSGMPVDGGYVISDFGYRIHPVYRTYRFHYGVDIKAYYTAVYATGKGVVTKASYQSGYGYTVEIDHGYGYVTKYAHMSKFSVAVGDEVVRGQQIGVSGNSGTSSGAHLHYEVWEDGVKIDPEPFLD